MSHFTRIRTRMVDRDFLIKAVEDLGYRVERGGRRVRGYAGAETEVDFRIESGSPGYDVGFQQVGDAYEIVADWWGIRDISQEQFTQRVLQRYAYNAALWKLEAQGFAVSSEEVEEDGRIHLVLRRPS